MENGNIIHEGITTSESSINLIRESPEQDRDHNTSPQLSHDIEEAKAPNPQDRNRTKKSRPKCFQKPVRQSRRVDNIPERVHEERECPKEGDEGEYDSVEKSLLRQHIGQLGVQQHESNRHWQVHPRLQEGDDLGAAPLCRHNQHVLRVP